MRIDEFKRIADGESFFADRLRISTVGFDLIAYTPIPPPPLNPYIMLQISNDGGFTWGNELQRPFGKIGDHGKSIYWSRLGRARDRVFKIVVSAPAKVIITNATLEAEEGIN